MEIKAKVRDKEKARIEELLQKIYLGNQAIRRFTRQVDEAKAELLTFENGEQILNDALERTRRQRAFLYGEKE